MKKVLLLCLTLFSFGLISHVSAEEYGMYVKAVENIQETFAESIEKIKAVLAGDNWDIVASYEASVPEGCGFRAYTIVLHNQEYADAVVAHGPTAAFALPVRISLYEDDTGLNAAFVNPASLNRTILGDETEKDLSLNTMESLSNLLASGLKGITVHEHIGQIRKRGRVGGMGGGNFHDKIEIFYEKEDTGTTFQDTAMKIKAGINASEKGWKLIYSLEIDDGNIIMYGLNKSRTEARAYSIAGEKRASKDNQCPGIDHAPAFPIEVIVFKDKGMVKAMTLDEMYRMKVYFEDAGKWAFMKNMRMPGQIEDEIVEASLLKLKK
jgi:hypothetical protein